VSEAARRVELEQQAGAASGSAAATSTARATIALHSRSFSLASRLLPAAYRDDAAVVYTYCRRTDDAVDEVSTSAEAIAAITRLRAELDEIYQPGAPSRLVDPVLARFATIAVERRLPRHYPDELIAGMAMDAAGERYATVDDLLRYAYRVAGVVGLMMCHVMGVRDDRALVPAAHLGIAMQLTNVCRDVAEDWRRRRLYLPAELLARHGATGLDEQAAAGEPLPSSAHPAIAAVTGELLALADRYYRSADGGVPMLGWRPALGVRAARHVYAAIGSRVTAAGCDPQAPRAVVPRWKQLLLVGRAALGGLGELPSRLGHLGPRRLPTITLELGHVDHP
jgi:15-cis-phytoene synthase